MSEDNAPPDANAGPAEPDSFGSRCGRRSDALADGREAVADVVVRRLSASGSVVAVWDFDHASRELICRHCSLPDLIEAPPALGDSALPAGWPVIAARPRCRTAAQTHAAITSRRSAHAGNRGRGAHSGWRAIHRWCARGVRRALGTPADVDLVALSRLAAVIAAGAVTRGFGHERCSARIDQRGRKAEPAHGR